MAISDVARRNLTQLIPFIGYPRTQLVQLTRYLTLRPGDVVLTGSAATFAPVKPGDRAEITLDGIGTRADPVRSR
jgi:2-keto-4-pentenoate hydratase/2-oxohepta-3-ene-1,7-dioic acid hydratase in catechol pathway